MDFHLLQTELIRKKHEVGSHERTLSRTSSLRSSMGKSAGAKLIVYAPSSSRDFLFKPMFGCLNLRSLEKTTHSVTSKETIAEADFSKFQESL